MEQRVAPLVGQFTVGTYLYRKALDGVERDALHRRPGPSSNPMVWVAGHLTQFRGRIVRLLGSERPIPWEDLFRTGSHLVDPGAYPDAAELLGFWNEVSGELVERLDVVGVDALAARPEVRVPSTNGTLGGALELFAFHEGYHLGQLGYLRKWLGYSPVLDG